eukprot:2207445-Prymnesium_polylepis.2
MEEVINADADAMAAEASETVAPSGIPLPPPVWGAVPDSEPEPPAMRFWNQRLKPLYDSCMLPVKSAPFAPHHHGKGAYRFSFTYQDGNQNWTFAPSRPLPPGPSSPSLSECLRPLVYPPAPPEPSRKKAKTNADSSSSSSQDDDPSNGEASQRRKKAAPFKRKPPLEGQLRAPSRCACGPPGSRSAS